MQKKNTATLARLGIPFFIQKHDAKVLEEFIVDISIIKVESFQALYQAPKRASVT